MSDDKKHPYIFLDFDGVCTSFEEGSYHTNGEETYGPSKTICGRLVKLCERTGAKIIVSSNWRKFDPCGFYSFGTQRVYNPLGKLKDILGEHIIGTLPKIRHISKAQALIMWMEENNFDYWTEKWVIVDDDASEGLGETYDCNIRDHYVQTVAEYGLTEDKIPEIENFLV